MLFITEYVDYQALDVICEQEATTNKKSYKITGPFLQAEVKNKNGRVYPIKLIEREVGAYNKEKIEQHRAFGELDHPPTPTINLQNISHIIESLSLKGNNGVGVAKILNTPNGRIIETILDAGGRLGVSTRGVGSLNGSKVNDDYKLLAIDAVADPSAPSAFVDGIKEGKEYIISGDMIIEQAVVNFEKNVSKGKSKDVYTHLLTFLGEIRKNLK